MRRFSSMASQTTSSPFSRAVVSAMRKLYPESMADKSFDNTGLLLEAPWNPRAGLRNSVLLTIDLTKAVAEEAIQKKCGAIVTYRACPSLLTCSRSGLISVPARTAMPGLSVEARHTFNTFALLLLCDNGSNTFETDPIIFRGLKSLTFANSQQSSLLRLAAEGISVRPVKSSHTKPILKRAS